MKIIQDKTTHRTGTGLLEDICIPPTMVACMSVEMTETLHLGKLSKVMHNKVIRSLRLGVHDSRGGLSAVIYRTLCDLYDLPQSSVVADRINVRTRDREAILDISAKDELIRAVRGTNARSYYSNSGADLKRGVIGAPDFKNGYYMGRGWQCALKRDEVAAYITKDYLEEHGTSVEAAIMDVRNGEELVFKTASGAI